MSPRDPVRWSLLSSIAGLLLLLAGCNGFSGRPKEHASTALLDTGRPQKVTTKQAADIQIAIGKSNEEEGKLEQAEAAYLAALKGDPKRADAENRLAILIDMKGNTVAADKHFSRALKLAPKDPEILCDQGFCLYLRHQWADAEANLKKAIASNPLHLRSHNNLGLVLARRGDTVGALNEFALAGCDPADARSNLGLMLALEGRMDEAVKEYKLALAAKPGSALAKEGLKAANVALAAADRRETRMLADAKAGSKPKTDNALSRTSTTANPSR